MRPLVLGLYKYLVFLLLIFSPPTIVSEAFSISFHPLLYPVYGRIESNSPSDVSLTNGAKTTFCEKREQGKIQIRYISFLESLIYLSIYSFKSPLPHIKCLMEKKIRF